MNYTGDLFVVMKRVVLNQSHFVEELIAKEWHTSVPWISQTEFLCH